MAWYAWYVDKAPAKTHKNRNARLDAQKNCVYTASDANWLRGQSGILVTFSRQ